MRKSDVQKLKRMWTREEQVKVLKRRVHTILRERDKSISHPTAEEYEKETLTYLRRFLKTGSIFKKQKRTK